MKKVLLGLMLVAGAMFALQGTAVAQCTDGCGADSSYLDIYNPADVYLSPNTAPYTFTFDLDNDSLFAGEILGIPYGSADINPGNVVTSAQLTLNFVDDARTDRDGDGWRSEPIEIASIVADSLNDLSNEIENNWFFIKWGTNYSANVLADVVGDHTLQVTLASETGDFKFRYGKLKGCYAEPVPEPATLLLLGSGLLGLGFFRKKRRAS